MADYGNYNTGTGDVISAIQRPALDVNEEQERIRQNLRLQNQQAQVQAQLAPYQQANDLVNQAIQSRQQIEARRNQLSQQLAGAGNRRQAAAVGAQIEGLDRAAHGVMEDAQLQSRLRMDEADQRRMLEHESASFAARALKTDREAAIDEQGASLMTGLGRLDAMHRNGNISSDQYDAGLLDLGQQYGLGLRHPDAGRMYEHFVGEADKRNAFNLRRTASEAARLAARYGIEPQLDEDGRPSIEATKQAAIQTPKGRNEAFKQMNDEMLQKYGVPTGVGSLFNPVEPHSDAEGGKAINIPFLDKKGAVGQMKVPKPLFDQMKADFNDRYFALAPQQNEPQVSSFDYNKIPAGSIYTDPNGVRRRKQ